MKYIGCAYIAVTLGIVAVSFAGKQNYDEYQVGILGKGVMIMGIAMTALFPIALLLVLSDPSYAIETLMFLVVVHWSAVLIADFVYTIKWCRQ